MLNNEKDLKFYLCKKALWLKTNPMFYFSSLTTLDRIIIQHLKT